MSSEASAHVESDSSGEGQELRLEVQLMLESSQGLMMNAMRHIMAGLLTGRPRVGQYPLR